ncbi:MAG: hypothetical protein ACD_19C00079G0045 [uncultured bacterium]|nr:MAG: hypothetical protein ACD_19C00079G0045 [uncultured bacterium]
MDKIIFFATLVIFPFGQLFKIGIFNLFDVAVLLLAMVTLWRRPKYPEWYRYFIYFILSCFFGLLLNSSLLTLNSTLYLLRFWSYSMVAIYVFNNRDIHNSSFIILTSVAVVTATFGWLQYLIWPDLTFLKYLGWDDHLLRMVGTFLDPTYLGLIIVLGIIIAGEYGLKKILYFLLVSLAFTYSRSSYLIAILFLIFKKQYLGLIIFALSILVLPKMIGEGTNLTRTVSGNNKLINYSQTLEIIKKSPVVGIGFNNICPARSFYLNDLNTDSHSCSGSDSSLLFLLATTGVVGLILFINFIVRIPTDKLLIYSFVAVLIHSIFANSLFYPHIMFWMFVLVGLQTEVDS